MEDDTEPPAETGGTLEAWGGVAVWGGANFGPWHA